jgi:hypothetical protein
MYNYIIDYSYYLQSVTIVSIYYHSLVNRHKQFYDNRKNKCNYKLFILRVLKVILVIYSLV